MPQLVLQVAPRYKVPAVYTRGTQEAIQEALTLGAKVQELVQLERESEELKEALEARDTQHAAELQALQNQIQSTVEQHRIAEAELTSLKVTAKQEAQQAAQKMRDLETALEKEAAEKCACLEAEIATLRTMAKQEAQIANQKIRDMELVLKQEAAANQHFLEAELAELKTAAKMEAQQTSQKIHDLETALQDQIRQGQEAERLAKIAAAQAERDARKQEREATLLECEGRMQKYQAAMQAAEERKAALEASRDRDIAATEERTKAMMSEIIRIREEQLKSADGSLKSLQMAYDRQAEELKSLNDFLRRKVTNVKTKGNEYEGIFRDLLLRAYQVVEDFTLLDTNKNGVGHAGDFLMRVGRERILWEVKHYDKPVPKQEADKFQRDMLEHKDIRVGVMVSRTTEMVGKTAQGDRHIEFVEGKLLIYLSRFEFLGDEVATLQSLMPLFRLWWSVREDEEQSEHVEQTLRDLEKLTADLAKRKTEWRLHRNRMDETARWMTEFIEEAEERVEAILKHMQSGTEDLEIPEGLFRSEYLDEKIRKTVGWILEDYEPAPRSEVRLVDMCDVLAARRKISKDLARKYILAALLDSAVHTVPGKATVVVGFAKKTT